RAVPPGAQIAAVRAAPAVLLLHRRGGGPEPAGVARRLIFVRGNAVQAWSRPRPVGRQLRHPSTSRAATNHRGLWPPTKQFLDSDVERSHSGGCEFSHWETTGWLVAVITMADVFISYPKARRALTERVARDLEAAGLSVWWDTRIQLGEGFRNQIDDQ